MKPKITLMTKTELPLETVYAVWHASKSEEQLITPQWVRDNVPKEEVEELFRAVIRQKIPIGEHVDFVFELEHVSVSFREQAVRHRIGTTPSPERVGVDIVMDEIPLLHKSSWWSQSMRIQDMGSFAKNEAYRLPPSLEGVLVGPTVEAERLFRETMVTIQEAYRALVAAGVPMEDARELIPLGATHRFSWKLNIGALQHIFAKRGCWILQLGLWGPVIQGMVEELVTKVHPIFAELVTPPCIDVDTDSFIGCSFKEECRRRYTGDDRLPPCPLHVHNHTDEVKDAMGIGDSFVESDVPRYDEMIERSKDYERFWNRDTRTGKRRLRVVD